MRPLAWIVTVATLSCNTASPPAKPVQVAHVIDDASAEDGPTPFEDAGVEPLRPPPTTAVGEIERSPHVALGVPRDADPSNDLVLDKGQFVLSYDGARSETNWAAWRLRASDLGHLKRSDRFYADELLPSGVHRVQPQDYAKSGFDRGHLCPSGDRTASQDANVATFVMTNIQPQTHDLNTGPWEALKAWSRDQVRDKKKELYIVAGGVFSGSTQKVSAHGGPGVPVPTKSFKVIIELDTGQGPADVRADTIALAVLVPNQHGIKARPWTDYVVPISQVERETGYDFLSKVPVSVQKTIEATAAKLP
jgi:endonuclease G